jgi:DUF1009 family protein
MMAASEPILEREGWGLIAGNGDFPLLVLEGACQQGIEMTVIAIREEASPELNRLAARVHWVGLGELGRALELLRQAGVRQAVLAGQVKHRQIYSDIPPDPILATVLAALPAKNTDALIGAVVRVLEQAGIRLVDSTLFLKPLLAAPGVLTRRAPDARERADIEYGRRLAREVARLDIGQTVVVADRACVAVEAMEGTDETIRRAARLANGRPLVVVKVSRPEQDMRYDVPVVGPETIRVMAAAGATALAMDAGRTLLLNRDAMLALADEAGIAVEASLPPDAGTDP